MAKGTSAAPDVATEAADPAAAPDRGTIHTLLGRGRTGKTTWARWAVERARLASRDVLVADGDRNNNTLGSFYPDARSPAAGDDVTMTAWLEDVTAEIVTRRGSLVLDMGGGDRAFATVAERHGFNEVLPAEGVDLVAWYFLAGGRDDFETLVHMEEMGFQPPRTVVVLNEGLAPVLPAGQDPFAAALRARSVQRVLDRGAKLLRMPAAPLATMVAADALFIGIHDAAHRGVPRDENGLPHANAEPLDMWRGYELKRWLAAMDERHTAAGIAPWLP